jgi:hypothetical protein
MQKIYIYLLTLFALNSLNSTINAAIYLRNNYGAPIEFVQATRETVNSQPTELQPVKLGNGSQVEVRLFFYLFIRSIGGSYYDISYIFKDIMVHQVNHHGEDAVIVIYPRQGLSGIYYWNVKIEWESPISMPTFSRKPVK